MEIHSKRTTDAKGTLLLVIIQVVLFNLFAVLASEAPGNPLVSNIAIAGLITAACSVDDNRLFFYGHRQFPDAAAAQLGLAFVFILAWLFLIH